MENYVYVMVLDVFTEQCNDIISLSNLHILILKYNTINKIIHICNYSNYCCAWDIEMFINTSSVILETD